ncbi:MAG TPA: hypothetical protein VMT15_14275 [Bryobacteraceae bacterium]|nr:hypothetical protein [Bryobacteraceae bacterium]
MTRRDLFLLPLTVLPVLASPPGEFWNEKKPEEWSPEEVREMLTRSPWAKEGAVSVFGGAGGSLLNRNGAMNRSGNMSSTGRQRTSTNQTTQSSDAPDLRYKAIVRWESALPIRLALKAKPPEGLEEFYMIALVGDLALADPDETDAERESRVDMLKQYTKLDKKGGAIPLVRIEPVKKVGTIFYFPRTEPIKDGQVTFITKMGPVEVKCKFTVKDMMFRGKLEL